jgi:hypothetical protein
LSGIDGQAAQANRWAYACAESKHRSTTAKAKSPRKLGFLSNTGRLLAVQGRTLFILFIFPSG